MSKNIKWTIVFLAVVLICVGVIFFGQLSAKHKGAEIYIGSQLYQTIESLENEDISTVTVETPDGTNTICYGEGKIWVEQADCKNQVCVNHAKASLVGEVIICAPHKLLIKVTGEDSSQADVVL